MAADGIAWIVDRWGHAALLDDHIRTPDGHRSQTNSENAFSGVHATNGGKTLCFNFAAVETSIIVVLTALATVPVLAALLSFVILREAKTRSIWQAIVMTMAGVLIVVFNDERAVAAPNGSVFLGGFLGEMTALCIAVEFIVTRRYPQTPVLLAVSMRTICTGFIGFASTNLDEMMVGSPWAVLVTCLLVMPLAWCLLSLAPRYTAPTNISLLMLLEMVLGPFWVWLGTGERPSPDDAGGRSHCSVNAS